MSFNSGIIGYIYRAATYCTNSECIPLAKGEGQAFDGWALGHGIYMATEDNLDEIAASFGIDRENEYTFDSDHFPKVILTGQVEEHQTCGTCGDEL